MTPALSHVDTWVFDLDQTLYPAEAEVMALIEGKMTAFVARETGLPRDEAYKLQKSYLSEHGTTLAGLMAHYGVEPHRFLDEVHDVSIDGLHPDAELNALIAALPGRKIVFTNGDGRHAERILKKLENDVPVRRCFPSRARRLDSQTEYGDLREDDGGPRRRTDKGCLFRGQPKEPQAGAPVGHDNRPGRAQGRRQY